MVANPNGADTPVGVWLDADAAPVVETSKTGRSKVKAGGKGTQGGSGTLAYRPGWHLVKIPYALQFTRGEKVDNELDIRNQQGELIKVGRYFPKDFVWAEVEYAADRDYQDEAMKYGINPSGRFQHSLTGLPYLPKDGSYEYRTNTNPATDPWIITGAMKVNRILTKDEVDALVRKAGRTPQEVEPEAQHLVNASDIDSRDGTEIVAVGKLSEAIKNGASRKDHYEHFRLAKTSDVLKQYGMTGEYLTIGAKVVFAHYAKDPDHALSEQDWANISEALKDSLVVAKYSLLRKDGTRYYPPKSYRVWVEAVVNGHFANVVVEVKSPSANTTVNSFSTVYGDEFVHINPKDVLYSRGKGEGIRTLLDGPNSRRYSESPALIDSIAYSGAEVNPVQTKNETPAEREQVRPSVFVGAKASQKIEQTKSLIHAEAMLRRDFGGEYSPEARDTIYVKTGWWRGTDGLWRFEIRDIKPRKLGSSGDCPPAILPRQGNPAGKSLPAGFQPFCGHPLTTEVRSFCAALMKISSATNGRRCC